MAIRSGEKPNQPDNVVQPFLVMQSGLYAHIRYIARHGRPNSPLDYGSHAFIQDLRSPISSWSDGLFPKSSVVFSSTNERINLQALKEGIGIGFYPTMFAEQDPELVQIHPPDPAWDIPFWLMTHIDLHWTPKVQAILKELRGALANNTTAKIRV